jgi:hypothetical protein
VTGFALAALLAVPTTALAQKTRTTTLPDLPGKSEFSPGHRAKIQGGTAKDYAPGQRMKTQNVRSVPGASEFAPGHQPGPYTNKGLR